MSSAPLAVLTCVHFPGDRLAPLLARLGEARACGAEIVLVLDGVTDSELSTASAWGSRLDGVHVVVAPEPHGVARARNLGLRAVSADYVWFIDDDDDWDARAIPVIMKAIRHLPDILVFRAEYRFAPGQPGRIVDGFNDRRRTTAAESRGHLLAGAMHGFLWSKVFARHVLRDDLFPELSSQSDAVGVARAFAAANVVDIIPDILYRYVNRPGSITRSSRQRFVNLMEANRLIAAEFSPFATEFQLRYFSAWFCCAAAVRSAARLGVPLRDVGDLLGPVQALTRRIGYPEWRARDARTAVDLVLLRIDARLAVLAARTVFAVLDGVRALRLRRFGVRLRSRSAMA